MFPTLPHSLQRIVRFVRKERRPQSRRRAQQPRFLVLEDRALLSTLTVTSSADSATQNHTLRYAVDHAQSGDTIQLTAAIKSPIVLSLGELVVSQSVTIESVPARTPTISGDGISRVFEISAGANVTLDNVNIIDGNGVADNPSGSAGYDGNGGAILNLGTLTVNSTTFGSNTAGTYSIQPESFGGAIDNLGTLTVNNSSFTSNVAHAGGAVENYGTLTVSNSAFTGNSATSFNFLDSGGGIDNNGTMAVTNSAFTGNECDNYGGGISNGATATVTSSTFAGNTVPYGNFAPNGGGGGIDNAGTLTFTGNSLSGNSTSGDGGGIINSGSMTVSGNMVSGNSANTGGGIINIDDRHDQQHGLSGNSANVEGRRCHHQPSAH